MVLQSVNCLIFNSIGFTQRYATPSKEVNSVYRNNAVRYASGFLIKELKKHYEKKKGAKARQFMECLIGMSASEEVHSMTTQKLG